MVHSKMESPPPKKRARSSSFGTMPPLSLSILGVEPVDEFIKEVADWIAHKIMTRPESAGLVEVEAKIGVLRSKTSSQRLTLPVLVETILSPENDVDARFESNMSASQHQHFNKLLNDLKMSPPPGTTALEYNHQHLEDSFFPSDNPRDKDKIRVSRDQKTKEITQCVRKVRLGSLDIYSPKRHADWRISVNVEVPAPHPLGTPIYTRRKDRLSYSHEECTVDLTQVKASATMSEPAKVTHELELEITRPALLLSTLAKRVDPNATDVDRSSFDELIRAFVNNARILVRNADGGWQ